MEDAAKKIMIVEDNTTVAEDARECLEGLGYQVTSIKASGEDAIAGAEKDRPDAVLMDIKLRGDMDGIEAAEQIQSQFDIPVVFLSAYSDRKLLGRAGKTSPFGYLVKPFEERELYAMLEMALYKDKAEKERRRMEVHLRRYEKMEAMSKMAGGVAHHFNNKLTTIIGNLEMALEDLSSNALPHTLVAEAKKAAVDSAEMSRLMLTFIGSRWPEKSPLDLAEMCAEWLKFHKTILPAKVSLSTDIPEQGPMIWANKEQLEELIKALFDNAWQAIEPDSIGRVSVRVTVRNAPESSENYCYPKDWADPDESVACLEIADNGKGMDAYTIERIMEPFFTSNFFARSGLGLSVVWGILKAHDGCISVESKLARGSAFRLFFPLLQKDDIRIPGGSTGESL